MATKGELKALLATLDITKNTTRRKVKELLADEGYSEPECRIQEGATKLCIVPKNADFVIKWSITYYDDSDDWDEALEEVSIYNKAVEAGLEMFFPKTEVFCVVNGITFVIQEKIDFSALNTPNSKESKYKYQTRTVSPIIIEKMDNCFYQMKRGRELNPLWASMAIVLYGKRKCRALCKFIVENSINDLHYSNIGYLKDKPIILDFSGYHRED